MPHSRHGSPPGQAFGSPCQESTSYRPSKKQEAAPQRIDGAAIKAYLRPLQPEQKINTCASSASREAEDLYPHRACNHRINTLATPRTGIEPATLSGHMRKEGSLPSYLLRLGCANHEGKTNSHAKGAYLYHAMPPISVQAPA